VEEVSAEEEVAPVGAVAVEAADVDVDRSEKIPRKV
jgi:hypothetical protein